MKHSNLSIFIPFAGCPHQCTFCDQHMITGASLIPDDLEIIRKIETCASRPNHSGKLAQIAFFGGSFTCISQEKMIHLLELVAPYIENGSFRSIRISTRPDGISPEILKILKKYHVESIELGAQSMDEGVLRLANRGHTPQDTANAAAMIREEGFDLGLQMLPGLPGDSFEKAMETAKKLIALKPREMRIYPAVVFPGTELHKSYIRGEYTPLTLDEALSWIIPIANEILNNNITLLKVGLHQADGAIVGAFHPAFGEMVRTGLFNRRLKDQLGKTGSYEIPIHPQELSIALGQKKKNLSYWKEKGYLLRFIQDQNAAKILK